MPIASAANFAQGAACLAVGLKAKNVKTKSVAIPSSLSAALGITEPAIFGINLRFVKPLVCGMIGGAVGSILGSIFHIGATSYGVTGIPGFLITLDYTLQYAIVLIVSFVISFALTWVVWKEETDEEQSTEPKKSETVETTPAPALMFAPLKGNVIARENIPDETFASGVLGDGVGIEPEVGEVVAPFDGEISTTTETKHAVGISGPRDMEVLIHVGIDTVNMKGDGFNLLVKEGDKVKAGQKLLTFDISKIKAAGYSTTTAVLLTNSDDFPNMKILKNGQTNCMEELLAVE
jgi:PTS system sucrose-specific IIC component